MTRRRTRQFVTLLLTVLLGAAAAWLRMEGTPPDRNGRNTTSPAPTPSTAWTDLQSPVLAGGSADDGDSFLIHHQGGNHTFRLYFVDCPEKQRHQHNRERLAEQGSAFGGLSEGETIRIGRAARDFTLGLLKNRPFHVLTRWEPVFDDRRQYAHVVVTQPDGTRRPLAELLVEAGLARIHTKGVDLPDGTRRSSFEHRLRTLEKSARLAGHGGWASFAEQNASIDR